MERLQYHEFGKQLKMFKLMRDNASDEQLARRRLADQLRDTKIKECAEMLRTDITFTVGNFLERLVLIDQPIEQEYGIKRKPTRSNEDETPSKKIRIEPLLESGSGPTRNNHYSRRHKRNNHKNS